VERHQAGLLTGPPTFDQPVDCVAPPRAFGNDLGTDDSEDGSPRFFPGAPDSELLAETHAEVGASPLTYEGIIQDYGKIAQTANRGTGWRRVTALVVCAIVLIPIAAALIGVIISRV
jgi:hypothetical protein